MKTHKYIYFLLILVAFSTEVFSQLDSVYYQGPSQGSVVSGAMQTTDNFPDNFSISGSEYKEIPPIDRSSHSSENLIFGWDASQLPEYKYVEDSPSAKSNSVNGGQTVLLNNFPGISMTNYIPPDPVIAAGPAHIIICANSLFKILDKEGNVLKTISAAGWWAPVWPDENGDPQVIYDHYANRWVLVWMQVNSSALTSGNLIAYSDDENPLGSWFMYRLDTKNHGTVPSNTWGDYPHVGFDEEAIYISTGCTDFAGGGHLYNKIRIINKSELYNSNAGPLTYTDFWNIHVPGGGSQSDTIDYIQPAISYTPGNGGWSIWASGVYNGPPVSADFYALYKIINPLTSPYIRGKVLPVQTYTSPPLANQLGGGLGIETIGWITRQPITRDGFLYTSHDIQNSLYPDYSSIKYLKVDLNSVAITENVEFGSEGYFYLFPALTIDKDHNIAVTFSRSADTEYIGAYYTTWHANDPAGFSPSLPYAEGMGNYVLTYSGSLNRWGDYFGIYLDPANDYDVWMISEYAASTNIWGTYVGHIRMVPYSGAHAFLSPHSIDFGDVEMGTTSSTISSVIANYGENDLVISTIASSFEDFNLVTSLTFPVTLASYDSLTLEFTYSPTTLGNTSGLYPIPTNDPDFQGIALSGNSYRIIPAIEKTIYASSGSQNSGNMMTINPTTGAGTNIGPSLFDEVTSIAINPLDGKIYGVIAGNSSADLVKINSGEGDAYLISTLNIPLMASIAYDTSGVLYGITRTGDLYTIDVVNGSANFVVDAVGSYLGITFHPATNELWATSRAAIPPNNDAIFTINLSTGDTSIIGHTGLGKQTNDIVFDENLNLFGVIGSSTLVNDFISINTSTGVGTIVGSTGIKHILGLAYVDQILTSVEDNISGTIPSDYDLKQNYPNPFNPTTKIDFSLPVESNVKLVIYNILGQEVIRLIDSQMSAGNHTMVWNANDAGGSKLTSGIYLYKLSASGINGNEFQEIKKMILMK